jgi:hypothetical protein
LKLVLVFSLGGGNKELFTCNFDSCLPASIPLQIPSIPECSLCTRVPCCASSNGSSRQWFMFEIRMLPCQGAIKAFRCVTTKSVSILSQSTYKEAKSSGRGLFWQAGDHCQGARPSPRSLPRTTSSGLLQSRVRFFWLQNRLWLVYLWREPLSLALWCQKKNPTLEGPPLWYLVGEILSRSLKFSSLVPKLGI